MTILYSDGKEIEATILEILQNEKNLSSDQAIARERYSEWPIRYHLCPERSNLVRHLNFKDLDVLELGAGMGAVSRSIAETARSLTVVEGTQARFDALSARLRDLKNWSGKVQNIQAFTSDQKFDVVCVFGVLEYAELYVEPGLDSSGNILNPFQVFLDHCRKFLKPGGALVLAIENKLGIKYWSGAAEDHTSRIFDGICGYPLSRSPKTFSRKELEALITAAGLSVVSRYYPFPDYKIPSSVMSERLLERNPALSADLATGKAYENYGLPRAHFFPSSLATRNIAQAGLLAEVANSFLFVASDEPDSLILKRLLPESNLAAWHYSNHRKSPILTIFHHTENDKLLVSKHSLTTATPPVSHFVGPSITIRWKGDLGEKILVGPKLNAFLANHAYFDDWDAFMKTLQAFLKWSFQHWALPPTHPGNSMNGRALDAVFTNAVVLPADGPANPVFSLFDLEWELEGQFAQSWFIFRNVYSLSHERELLSTKAPFKSLRDLYEKLCTEFGIIAQFEIDAKREAAFQTLVIQGPDEEIYFDALSQLLEAPLEISTLPRFPQEEADRHREIRELNSALAQQSAQSADLEGHLRSEIAIRDRINAELQQHICNFQSLLAAPRYRLADKANNLVRKIPGLNQGLGRAVTQVRKLLK